MVSDGFGPASEAFARQYYTQLLRQQGSQLTLNLTLNEVIGLPLDNILAGQVRTHSFDSSVTDSAAGATAYACGLHTQNHRVGMD